MKNLCTSSKGQAFVLVVAVIFVLLALAALAIDIGMAYGVRAKLNAAADVAALAAGRVVAQGQDTVVKEANNIFAANYPGGLLGSSVDPLDTVAKHNDDGSWTITVNAKADVPTNFARFLGWPSLSVQASAISTVRTLDLVLVLDVSASLDEDHSPGAPALLKSAATKFIKNFDPTSDRIGLIHFASGVVQDATLNASKDANGKYFDKDAINTAINNLNFIGGTTTEEAMRLAKVQLDLIPPASQNSLRVIVLFTDGAPNGIAGKFTGAPATPAVLYSLAVDSDEAAKHMYALNAQSSEYSGSYTITIPQTTDYTGAVNLRSDLSPPTRPLDTDSGGKIRNISCNVNKAARNMLENVANAARGEKIHVFTIGLGTAMTTQEVPDCYGLGTVNSSELGGNILRRLANVPGVDTYDKTQPAGLYAYAENPAQLDDAFKQVANMILRLSK